jgi:hypothetical protein
VAATVTYGQKAEVGMTHAHMKACESKTKALRGMHVAPAFPWAILVPLRHCSQTIDPTSCAVGARESVLDRQHVQLRAVGGGGWTGLGVAYVSHDQNKARASTCHADIRRYRTLRPTVDKARDRVRHHHLHLHTMWRLPTTLKSWQSRCGLDLAVDVGGRPHVLHTTPPPISTKSLI